MISYLFTPDEIIDKFEDFNPEKYYSLGYRVILLDIDNTLVDEYTPDPNETAKRRVEWLKNSGFEVIIYSNNTTERVKRFCQNLDVEWYAWSFKPLFLVYFRIWKRHHFNKKTVLTMGDQLVTDVFGTKKFGLTSIYVKPFSVDEKFYTRFNRNIEKFLFKYVVRK